MNEDLKHELEAMINTNTYFMCKKVYDYCESEYNKLLEDYNALETQYKLVENENYELRKDCSRYREMAVKFKKQRDKALLKNGNE
jgi:cell shape-determining protein MreC